MSTPDPLKAVQADVAKVTADVKADEAKVLTLRAKAAAWVAANPAKVVAAGVVIVLLLAWKLI
jgi:hypothetical protein